MVEVVGNNGLLRKVYSAVEHDVLLDDVDKAGSRTIVAKGIVRYQVFV